MGGGHDGKFPFFPDINREAAGEEGAVAGADGGGRQPTGAAHGRLDNVLDCCGTSCVKCNLKCLINHDCLWNQRVGEQGSWFCVKVARVASSLLCQRSPACSLMWGMPCVCAGCALYPFSTRVARFALSQTLSMDFMQLASSMFPAPKPCRIMSCSACHWTEQ